MEQITFQKSIYSRPFKMLSRIGLWHIQTNNKAKGKLHFLYENFVFLVNMFITLLFVLDFVHHFGNLKRMAFNLGFSIIFIPELFKHYYLLYQYERVEFIRRQLHNSWQRRNSEEYREINLTAVKEVKFLYTWFYFTYWFNIPIGIFLFYIKRKDEFPFPLRPPFEMDFSDSLQFHLAFFVSTILSFGAFLFILEEEMLMFILLIQVSREYNVLINDASKVGKILGENMKLVKEDEKQTEVNPILRKNKIKNQLKDLCQNQEIISQ